MKWRVTFQRRGMHSREAQRKVAIEVIDRDEAEARAKATADGDRQFRASTYFKIESCRRM